MADSKTEEDKVPLDSLDSINSDGKPEEGQLEEGPVADTGIKTFEDLLEIIGTFGRWNIITFFIINFCTFVGPFQFISYEFIGATPDYWCRVESLMDANWTQHEILNLAIPTKNGSRHERCQMYDYNYTLAVELGYEAAMENRDLISGGSQKTIACYSREFNHTQYESSLVTEFDLVCERRPLYSSTQAAAQGGHLVGGVIAGVLNEKYGRRRIVLWCVVLSLLTGCAAAVSPVLEVYILMKFLVCAFEFGFYSTCFVILIEICSPSQRSSVASLFALPWAFSYMTIPAIAYYIRPWRWLQFAYTLPVILLISYFWLLPESPRWLISEGRYEDAFKVISWAAKVNRRPLPPKEDLIKSMKRLTIVKEVKPKENIFRSFLTEIRYLLVLVTTPEFRLRAIICYICWFAVSMVYHGVSLNSGNLSADPYLYMFLGGMLEVPSYILLWPSIAYFGRKVSLISQYFFCGVSISLIAILMLTLKQVPVGILMFLSLFGKLFITATFHLLFVYTAELFPTKYRSLAVGECSMMARVGSMISPFINDILGDAVGWGPSALFAALSILAACLAVILPETKGRELNEEKTFKKVHNTKDKEAQSNYITLKDGLSPTDE